MDSVIGADQSLAQRRARVLSLPAMLVFAGGGAIAVGAWLPWMFYFAGLVPLRGMIGLNGRLLFAAGVFALIVGVPATWSNEPRVRRAARRANGILGVAIVAAAAWLLLGVRELTRVHASNAMLVPRAGIGLVVVLAGGVLLAVAAAVAGDRRTD